MGFGGPAGPTGPTLFLFSSMYACGRVYRIRWPSWSTGPHPLPSFLLFQLLMDLRNHESAQRGIMFFSLFRALKLLLKQWLPVGDTLWVFKFLFSNKLHFLE